MSEDICEHLDELIDNDTDPNLQKLAHIFSGTKDHQQEFHHVYGRPLLDSGFTLDDSLAMFVERVLFPN